MMPRTIMIDFERSATDAFPTANFNGCFYRLRHNILRKIDTEDLQVVYQTFPEVEEQTRMNAAIAFAPLAEIETAFEALPRRRAP